MKHEITFERDADIECIVRAELGQSTKRIMQVTGLSASQITYRLAKAKRADKLPHGTGYRTAWRDGTSMAARQVFNRWSRDLRRSVLHRLPPHFKSPPAANGS